MKRYLIYFLAVLLSVCQIIVSNALSHYGKKISEIHTKITAIETENERLKKNIASESAVANTALRAKELGFEIKADVIYLDDNYSVAQNSL